MLEQIQRFFIINDVIVQFVHGQVFLLLGVSTGLQAYRRSRLELARALPWLASFGVLEAIATWGNTFIPIQERLLDPGLIQSLRFLQLSVYLLCFASLLGFGLRLLEPAVPVWAAPTVSLLAVMAFGALITTNRLLTSGVDVIGNATLEALLRYLLCLPAALLAAFGLRQQAGRLIGPLQAEHLVGALRIVGFGFVIYALVEGLLVPEAPFFPASALNTRALFNATGLPAGLIRAVVGLLIAYFMFRSLEAFRIEADRIADELSNQQALNAERERISRDLHDGTLQNIYAAGLMIDAARHSLTSAQPPQIELADSQLSSVLAALNKTTGDIRGTIYDLRRSIAGDEDLTRGLLDIVTEFRLRTTIMTDWSVQGCGQFKISPERRYHVYQIAREALSNIARHSHATRARVELKYEDCQGDIASGLTLTISDNGRGSAGSERVGKGLLNMRERATLLKGDFAIHSENGQGTRVELRVYS